MSKTSESALGGGKRIPALVHLFPSCFEGSVLDVGCRDAALGEFVGENYVGLDIQGEPTVLANLEQQLPFADRSFSTVVALDVLEHIDAIHQAFDELCRVSDRYVILALPNVYEWRYRLTYLLGKPISGKYRLTAEPQDDRHRWIFTLAEAEAFVDSRARSNQFRLVRKLRVPYQYRRAIPKLINKSIAQVFGTSSPLVVDHWWSLLERESLGNLSKESLA